MVAPALGFFLVFAIIPLIVALYLSFTRWDAITDPAWVGLDNWASVLVDPVAIDALVLTLKVIVISWIVQTPISLLLGTWTAGKQRNRAVLGAIFFLPLLLSSAATAIAFKAILDPNFGLSASLGIPFLKQDWLGNQQLVLFVVIFIIAWQFVPFHTLLFQGGVRQIPASLYEAAEIDGAGQFRLAWSIKIPAIRPAIMLTVIFSIIGSFQLFAEPSLLNAIAPAAISNSFTPNYYGYNIAFINQELNYAAAIAFLLGLVIAIVSYFVQLAGERRERVGAADRETQP